MTGADPTRFPVVGVPLVRTRLAGARRVVLAAAVLAPSVALAVHSVEPDALDGVTLSTVLNAAGIHVVAALARAGWELWSLRGRLRSATAAVAVTPPPDEDRRAGRLRRVATIAGLGLAVAAAMVAFDGTAPYVVGGLALLLAFSLGDAGAALVLARHERRHGRRYFALGDGEEKVPEVVWMPALGLPQG
jgi:hypothetical protein